MVADRKEPQVPRRKQKTEIITFKADESLLEAMERIPNRSEFIRGAVSAALEGVCPLCNGSGVLTPAQKTHWEVFAADHPVVECDECHEEHLICPGKSGKKVHRTSQPGAGRIP